MACDVDALVAEGACYQCGNEEQQGIMKLVLLCQILEVIGGGGVGSPQQIYTGGSPPAAPDDPSLPAMYYPTGGGTVLQWDGASWV